MPPIAPDQHELKNVPASARDRLIAKIKEDTGLPTLGKAIAKVVEITSSGEDSVSNLAHFILSDVALTQKILRLSNTIQYRTAASAQVSTISRAIFLLGFNTVKTSATAMLLVDCFKDKQQAHSVRKELVHALCSSIMARELSQRSRFPEAEEAAVAALFKNIGKVLVASFDHPLYARIMATQDKDETSAQESVNALLGCSFERFGATILQDWKIPDSIVQAQAPLPSGELKKATHKSDWLKQVASFSNELASVMLNADKKSPARSVSARCTPLLSKFGNLMELDKTQLEEILRKVESETRQLANSMDIMMPAMGHDDEVEDDADTLLDSEFMLQSFSAHDMEKAQCHPSGKPTNARDLLLAGMQDVMQMLASDQIKLNDMILLVLETLYSAMGFRFATVCLRDAQKGCYVARVSMGEHYAERQSAFSFPVKEENTVFHLAMTNNVDLMIADASVPKIQNLLPQWHKNLLPDTRSFMILPLVVQHKPLGFFYADRALAADEGVPPDETALIKTLKSQLLAAMMRK